MPQAVGAAPARRVRPDLRRRLRPDRDGRAQPRQPARARQAAVPGHPVLRRRLARRRPADAEGAADRRGRARSSRAGRWSSRATGSTPRRRPAAFVEFDGRAFFRTGDLGRMDEEGYFFITDRLKRMINASGFKVWPAEVETAAVQAPGGAGGLHHRRQATPTAARPSRRSSCCAPTPRARPAPTTSSPGRARTWPPTRCPSIVAVRRRAAEVGLGQGDVAAAAGPGSGAGG